jgi:2-oxoisovalerate dehydrogenase E1 component
VLASAKRTRRLIVVHEDNRTVGMGAEIVATVTEKADVPVVVRRLARSDAHVPFNFRNQLEMLPSYSKLVDLMAEVLECEVTWHEEDDSGPTAAIKAIGSGPADENVLITDLLVSSWPSSRRRRPRWKSVPISAESCSRSSQGSVTRSPPTARF